MLAIHDDDRTSAPPPNRAGERILAAASDLFYRHGVKAVSVDQIVEAAGATKPTLYRYFPSKAELAAEYVRRLVTGERAVLALIAAAHPFEPLAQLRAIVAEFAGRMAMPDYRGCAITNLAVEIADPDHPAKQLARAYQADIRMRLADLARRAALGQPEELADGLVMLLEGASVLRHSQAADGPSHALANMADELISAHARGW